jgi:thiosulfate/3-mercaptopyruvate sulfurtransferase
MLDAVIQAEWLFEHLNDKNICVLDATVHLPDTGRDAAKEFLTEHIPGSIFFDLSVIADPNNPLPRKVPEKSFFEQKVSELGIDNETHVIAYDTLGLYSAARVWWLFRLYGYDNVSILDGGLKNWKQLGLPVDTDIRAITPAHFVGGADRNLLARKPEVLKQSTENHQILDARTSGRFAGTEMDRYPGTRPGHIPGSRNLYWSDLLDKESRRFLPPREIQKKIEKAGITLDQPVTLTCGSGLTACILALGLHLCGINNWKVYDGSWDEWGRDHKLPVASLKD